MRLSICLLATATLFSTSAVMAHADDIQFNAQAAGASSVFTGVADSPLTIGVATFTGGQLLNNETASVDLTGVYATTSFLSGYSNPLGVSFSTGVSNFRVDVTNNLADFFTVSDNLGDSMTLFLAQNSTTTFNLSGSGLTSVRISEAGPAWDFAIDDVHFTQSGSPSPSPVPEPSSIALLGTGILGAFGTLRRKLLNR